MSDVTCASAMLAEVDNEDDARRRRRALVEDVADETMSSGSAIKMRVYL
jgi:hypothetical protein